MIWHVFFTLFIKDVLQNIWRTTYLLTVHPKLNFWGALRKSLMAPEDRSYQTQCFAKIFPIQVFPLRILCYFSKTWLKIWRKSWWSSLFLWNRLILQIYFFCILHHCCWENSPTMHDWRKVVFMKPHLYFFYWNTSDCLYLL